MERVSHLLKPNYIWVPKKPVIYDLSCYILIDLHQKTNEVEHQFTNFNTIQSHINKSHALLNKRSPKCRKAFHTQRPQNTILITLPVICYDIQRVQTLCPLSMYFIATSSFVSLFLISLATPKLPEPISFTSSYFSIFPIFSAL